MSVGAIWLGACLAVRNVQALRTATTPPDPVPIMAGQSGPAGADGSSASITPMTGGSPESTRTSMGPVNHVPYGTRSCIGVELKRSSQAPRRPPIARRVASHKSVPQRCFETTVRARLLRVRGSVRVPGGWLRQAVRRLAQNRWPKGQPTREGDSSAINDRLRRGGTVSSRAVTEPPYSAVLATASSTPWSAACDEALRERLLPKKRRRHRRWLCAVMVAEVI